MALFTTVPDVFSVCQKSVQQLTLPEGGVKLSAVAVVAVRGLLQLF